VNRLFHSRVPTPVDQQPVIRMNRDTLYSGAIVDISEGATLRLPNAGTRYMSAMVVNDEHYTQVFSEPGDYSLDPEVHGSEYVTLAIRSFVDSSDPADIAQVNELQDSVQLEAGSARPYTHPEYDATSLDATRDALLTLATGLSDTNRMFGIQTDVEPVRHLLGTASAWGGLPQQQALYYLLTGPNPVGRYTFTFRDVPVDGFWSLAVYNRDGYLEANPFDSFGLNSVTALADSDGSVTLNLSPEDHGLPNHVYVMDGWNYAIRLYQPRAAVLDGSWQPPAPQSID
jgi:hypothetical protein